MGARQLAGSPVLASTARLRGPACAAVRGSRRVRKLDRVRPARRSPAERGTGRGRVPGHAHALPGAQLADRSGRTLARRCATSAARPCLAPLDRTPWASSGAATCSRTPCSSAAAQPLCDVPDALPERALARSARARGLKAHGCRVRSLDAGGDAKQRCSPGASSPYITTSSPGSISSDTLSRTIRSRGPSGSA